MGEEVEGIDAGTEMMLDALLSMDDPLDLIATEQFFLESFAMGIFEGMRENATHPLLRRLLEIITRDESRHMSFGVLYLAGWMGRQPIDRRIAFARRWMGQILGSLLDRAGPIMLARVMRRLRDAGVADWRWPLGCFTSRTRSIVRSSPPPRQGRGCPICSRARAGRGCWSPTFSRRWGCRCIR